MELNKEELIKFGKRLNEWGCTVPSDILDCAADEHLQGEVAKNISSNVPIMRSVCDSQEHDRLVAWYGRCVHCRGTKMN